MVDEETRVDEAIDEQSGGGIVAIVLLIVVILMLVFLFREELGLGSPTMEVEIPDRIEVEPPPESMPEIDEPTPANAGE